LSLPNIQTNDTIGGVTTLNTAKALVTREKSGAAQSQQKRNDGFVEDPFALNVTSNVPHTDAPRPQEVSLVIQYVLVKQIHAGTDSIT